MALIVLLFIVLPFVELTLLLRIGSEIGALNTIAIVVATGIVGGYLAKREGLNVWRRFQSKMGSGVLPGDELLDGLIVLVSGALLITPGVLTDVVGLLGLLPPTRLLIKQQLRKRVSVHSAMGMGMRTGDAFSPNASQTSGEDKVDITRIVERRTDEAG
jgi:UPF0716 protein FxsA